MRLEFVLNEFLKNFIKSNSNITTVCHKINFFIIFI